MAGEHNWADGEVLRAIDVDSVLEQQVTVITTSGARGSTWLGKQIYETDTNLHRYWDGAAWQAKPRGGIDRSGLIQTGPGIGTTRVLVNNSSLTDTLVSGERYYYQCGMVVRSNVDGTIFSVNMEVNGTSIDYADVITAVTGGGNQVGHRLHMGTVITGYSGLTTMRCTILRTVGTGTGQVDSTGDAFLLHTS